MDSLPHRVCIGLGVLCDSPGAIYNHKVSKNAKRRQAHTKTLHDPWREVKSGLCSLSWRRWCGKQVIVYHNGQRISAPDGGDFFVWDGCQACAASGMQKIDFSAPGIQRVDPNGCNLGVVPNVSYKITDKQVKQFVP